MSTSSPMSILAVDDEPFNLDLIELAFAETADVTVHRAENGRAALEILAAEPGIQVVLLDLAMPVMNGYDFLERLRREPTFARLPVIVVTANREEKHRALALGANDFLAKPLDVEELRLRTGNYARIKDYQDRLDRANAELEERVRQRTRELEDALTLAKRTEQEIAVRLGRASEYRDIETGMHIRRMAHYSARLAELAGFADEEVEMLLFAAPLHDIGKVGIPDGILLKPGRLSAKEYQIMQLHAALGAEMLADAEAYPLLAAGALIAAQHHEKYDGSGYPAGLAGERIHPYGRITAIADVFDALSSKRIYKPAFSLDKTVAIMRAERGAHFDPDLLDLFLEHLDDFIAIKARFPDQEEDQPPILKRIASMG